MTTLITGGGSQVGTLLAHHLKQAGRNVLFGSRSGSRIPEGFESVKLDWDDNTTFENPFKFGHNIESVYLLGPTASLNPAKGLIPFIGLAAEKGVKRFIYLSGSGADEDNDVGGLGRIPGYLREKGLDRFILRPTWFIDNLRNSYGQGIRTYGQFESVIPTGRVPFVATDDIAKVALEGILADENKVKDVVIIGPDLLTYDELASITSSVLGKKVVHKVVAAEELKKFYLAFLPDDVATWLVEAELGVEAGSEETWSSLSPADQECLKLRVFVGKTGVREWLEKHKENFA